MRNNRKTLGITIIILGLIILGFIIYLTFFAGQKSDEPLIEEEPFFTGQLPPSSGTTTDPTTTPGDQPRNYQQYDLSQEDEHKINQHDLVKISQAFAERFGSYSNYSNYSNFSDLKIFMTDTMKAWADKYVSDLRSSSQSADEYYGITTKAVTSIVEQYNDAAGTASILVTTQRRENSSQVNEGQVFLQKIQIGLKKIAGEWLVDRAYWQPLAE